MYRSNPTFSPSIHRVLVNFRQKSCSEAITSSSSTRLLCNRASTGTAVYTYPPPSSVKCYTTCCPTISLINKNKKVTSIYGFLGAVGVGGVPSMHAFSSAAVKVDDEPTSSDDEGPRSLPTVHSRHHPPPIAQSIAEIEELSSPILKSIPGTLFEYTSNDVRLSKQGEYDSGLEKSNVLTQTIEYILRGHAARIPNTIWHSRSLAEQDRNDDIKEDNTNVEERLNAMLQLLRRIEEEGKVFVDLRSTYRCQLVMHDSATASVEEEGFDDGNDESNAIDAREESSWRVEQFKKTYGAEPGPSTSMYDIILDAISVHICNTSSTKDSLHWIRTANDLRLKANARYAKDVQTNMEQFNVDRLSTPTSLTFNAVLRTVANAPYSGKSDEDELRDMAIEVAFTTYDSMFHHRILERNSATFRYMFEVLAKYFPENTQSRGNIAYAIFIACKNEHVLDEDVLTALLEKIAPVGSDHGYEFDKWIERDIRKRFNPSSPNLGFPLNFSSMKKTKRHDKRSATY